MKRYQFLFVLIILLTACQTATPLPTATSLPASMSTPVPTPTNTPEPTATLEPSPTPIALPDPVNQTFSGVSVVHRETFEYVIQNAVPAGWESEERYAIWVTKENQLKVQPTDNGNWSGTVFYFSGEKIIPNTGVYFTFKYTGTAEGFTLGFDNVNPSGQRITGDNFHSVAMELRNSSLLVYGTRQRNQVRGSFKGNLALKPDTWYDITLGHDTNDNFVIKIWDPADPEKQLSYLRTWEDFPTAYYFISWISAKRSLLMDDFTVFKFDEIIIPE